MSNPYLPTVARSAAEFHVPADVLAALLQAESGFNPHARSPVGAEGIAQFMPGTARGMGIDPWDPNSAIPGAARYLSNALKTNHGDLRLALASYNAGQGAVNRYGGIPPYAETQNYVRSILAGRSRFPRLANGTYATTIGGATAATSGGTTATAAPPPSTSLSQPQSTSLETIENPAYARVAGIQQLISQNAQNAHIAPLNLPLPSMTITQPVQQVVNPPRNDTHINLQHPSAPTTAAVQAGPDAARVVRLAQQYLGTPYAWGGTTPKGFDCSGFAQFLYHRLGVNLPRTSEDQFLVGHPVNQQQLAPGDLVFFKGTDGPPSDVGHEGIYIGNGRFIHAPHTGDVVKISNLNDPYYQAHWAGGRRVA